MLGERTGYSILPYLQIDALIMHRSSGGFDPVANARLARRPRVCPWNSLRRQVFNAIEFVYFGLDGGLSRLAVDSPGPIPASNKAANGKAPPSTSAQRITRSCRTAS